MPAFCTNYAIGQRARRRGWYLHAETLDHIQERILYFTCSQCIIRALNLHFRCSPEYLAENPLQQLPVSYAWTRMPRDGRAAPH